MVTVEFRDRIGARLQNKPGGVTLAVLYKQAGHGFSEEWFWEQLQEMEQKHWIRTTVINGEVYVKA